MGWNCLVGAYECKNYNTDTVVPDDLNFIATGFCFVWAMGGGMG